MTQVNMFEAKSNLSKLAKMLEDGVEDYIIIARSGQPLLKLLLVKDDVSKRVGFAKGQFTVPEDFDEFDISGDFSGEIF